MTAATPPSVEVVNPDIELTKNADPSSSCWSARRRTPEPVTYTFTATNTGDAPLNRPGATAEGPAPPTRVDDPICGLRSSPGDLRQRRRQRQRPARPRRGLAVHLSRHGHRADLNIAADHRPAVRADGTPFPASTRSRTGAAVVNVVGPGSLSTKTALRDPWCWTPTPRGRWPRRPRPPTGRVPLPGREHRQRAAALDATRLDDICGPLVPRQAGDTNGDGLLDPDEVWDYTCAPPWSDSRTQHPAGHRRRVRTRQNTVTVTGVPFFDGELVPGQARQRQDTAQVLVIEPGLRFTKTASTTRCWPATT